LKNEKGEEVALKEGAPVDVTIEAEEKDTTKRQSSSAVFNESDQSRRSTLT